MANTRKHHFAIYHKLTGRMLHWDLTLDEASKILGVSRSTVYEQAKKKRFGAGWEFVRLGEYDPLGEPIPTNRPLIIENLEKGEVVFCPNRNEACKILYCNPRTLRYTLKHKSLMFQHIKVTEVKEVGNYE